MDISRVRNDLLLNTHGNWGFMFVLLYPQVESATITAFVELVAKLNDTAFRPLFRRLFDWAFQGILALFFVWCNGGLRPLLMSFGLLKVPDATTERKIAFCNAYMGLLDYFKVRKVHLPPASKIPAAHADWRS